MIRELQLCAFRIEFFYAVHERSFSGYTATGGAQIVVPVPGMFSNEFRFLIATGAYALIFE